MALPAYVQRPRSPVPNPAVSRADLPCLGNVVHNAGQSGRRAQSAGRQARNISGTRATFITVPETLWSIVLGRTTTHPPPPAAPPPAAPPPQPLTGGASAAS